MFIGFLLVITAACESCFEPAPTVDAILMESLDGGWPEVVIQQPAAFRAFAEGPESAGWSSFYHGDLSSAERGLGGVPLRRVFAEQTLIAQDLERLARLSFQLNYQAWLDNEAIGPQSPLPMAAVLAAIDREDSEAAIAWLERVPEYENAELNALAKRLSRSGLKPPVDGETSSHADCVHAQLAARSEGDFNLLGPCGGARNSVLFKGGPSAGHGLLYNPLLYSTYARIAEIRQKDAGMLDPSEAQAPGLEYLLFSKDWNLDDIGASLRSQTAPSLAFFGLGDFDERKDDTDAARAWITHLDLQLDSWQEAVIIDASENGRQVAFEVMPLEIYRAGLFRHQARMALARGNPMQAMIFLNSAFHVDQPRQIGARNRASFYLLRAEARLMSGRTREALEDLLIIAEAYPHIYGLQETMNDLSIMQNSSRSGDSKEH